VLGTLLQQLRRGLNQGGCSTIGIRAYAQLDNANLFWIMTSAVLPLLGERHNEVRSRARHAR
jgi:hypothetical protein